jgi:hypothetical protein
VRGVSAVSMSASIAGVGPTQCCDGYAAFLNTVCLAIVEVSTIKPKSAAILKRQLPQLANATSEQKTGRVQNIARLAQARRFTHRPNAAPITNRSKGIFPRRLCEAPFQKG